MISSTQYSIYFDIGELILALLDRGQLIKLIPGVFRRKHFWKELEK